MAANTRGDVGPIGELPAFGGAVSSSPGQITPSGDINTYSDRAAARMAGEAAETSSRAFDAISSRLGQEAQQSARYEGAVEGKVAGADPNFRPNADETVRGRAFNEAATQTYLNTVDASSKVAATQAYSQYMALPPGQRQPAMLQKSLDGIAADYKKNHLFPEIQGDFDARFGTLAAGYMAGAQSDLEATQHANAQASLVTDLNATSDAGHRIAAQGLDASSPAVAAQIAAYGAKVDQAVKDGTMDPVGAVNAKREFSQSILSTATKARFDQVPDAEKPAWAQAFSRSYALPANWSDGITFGKAGPNSAQTSPNDGITPDVKSGLVGLRQQFGQPFTITSTTQGQHAPGSEHYAGKAVDVSIAGWDGATIEKFVDSARAAGFTGFGLGATHIHIDMRPGQTAQVFPDAYAGPVAGRNIAEWQAHLNGQPAPSVGAARADGMTLQTVSGVGGYMSSALRAVDSQAALAAKAAISDMGAARSSVIAGYDPGDRAMQDYAQRYATSTDPNVAGAYQQLVETRAMISNFKGLRPDQVEAQVENYKGMLARDGATPYQVDQLKAAQEFLSRYRGDLNANMIGRAASDGVVPQVSPLDPGAPKVDEQLRSRAVAVQHASDYYGQPGKFFQPDEGKAFAAKLAQAPNGLAGVEPAILGQMAQDEGFRSGLLANSRSGDPERMAASFAAMKTIADANPMEFEATFGKQAAASMGAWNALIGANPAPVAARLIMALNDPSQATARQYKDDAANAQLKTIDGNAVVRMLDDRNALVRTVWRNGQFAPPISTTDLPQGSLDGLRSDFADAYKIYAAIDPNPDAAKADAIAAVQRKWGVSAANGGRLMRYPPEKAAAYPPVDGSFDYIGKQLGDFVKATVGDTGGAPSPYAAAHGSGRTPVQAHHAELEASQPILVPDGATATEVGAGQPPGYRVIVTDNAGRQTVLESSPGVPARFKADPGAARAGVEQTFTAARGQAAADAAAVDTEGHGTGPK